jgi:hypothetical protein
MFTFTYVQPDHTEIVLELPDAEWITDYAKIHNVTVRRSMSGIIRTYVVRDRKFAHALTYNLRFNLHRTDIRKLKKFLALCTGHYVWATGIDSNCSAVVSEYTAAGEHIIKISNATGSINVGDYAKIDTRYYALLGVSASSLTLKQGLVYPIEAEWTVDIIKQQMVIINNQQYDYSSEGRAAGDEDDEENPGVLTNVEDETYNVVLSILVIKT